MPAAAAEETLVALALHCRRGEGFFDQLGLFLNVAFQRSGRRAGAFRTACVADSAALAVEERLDVAAHEGPRAHVARLFLHPDYLARQRIPVQDLVELGFRTRIELFHSYNCRMR